MAENRILLRGQIGQPPVFSHESHGKKFYLTIMEVPRLSGAVDCLNLLLPERLLSEAVLEEQLEVTGQVRSFNNRSGTGSRLVITVFVRTLTRSSMPAENKLWVSGSLCKPPVFRRTPLGREICDMMLAVPRSYGRSDYLPCICWGTTALTAAALSVGDKVTLEGRLQSRNYIKVLGEKREERVAYEVSVTALDLVET